MRTRTRTRQSGDLFPRILASKEVGMEGIKYLTGWDVVELFTVR